MRKALSVSLAALILASSTSAYASDRYRWSHHNNHGDHDDAVAAAVIAGLIGLAVGAAAASSKRERAQPVSVSTGPEPLQPRRDETPWYGPYSEGPDMGCFVERWVNDPSVGHKVRQRKAVWCDEPEADAATAN